MLAFKRIEILRICSQLTGFVFLLSAITKALDIYAFQYLIVQIGFSNINIFAPAFVLLEAYIALCLLLQVKVKSASYIGIFLLFVFTIAYSYGYYKYGIVDCGCFGTWITISSPIIVYVRNAVLLCVLILIVKAHNADFISSCKAQYLFLLIFVPIVFLAGMTYKPYAFVAYQHPIQSKHVEETFLNNIVERDGTSKLLFFFTKDCNYCLNSIANYKAYKSYSLIDTTMAFMLVDELHNIDTVSDSIRKVLQDIDYEIADRSKFDAIDAYPMSFYIKNDSVKQVIVGQLPSPALFSY